ncbi:MAG: 5-formyltetrahydrofolate cyclo-ligase, partial [Actinomycetota bacterium]|nr:5-formyltetrahydrofolate cyclo-ligase [Actinomycetota bacterium]
TRLGRGGGSYDRSLARVAAGGRGRTVALLHDGELLDRLPREEHDVPVQAVVTPSGGLREVGRPG